MQSYPIMMLYFALRRGVWRHVSEAGSSSSFCHRPGDLRLVEEQKRIVISSGQFDISDERRKFCRKPAAHLHGNHLIPPAVDYDDQGR